MAPILYSPMMGMGSGLAIFTENQATVIEDYMFSASVAGEITPLATGTVSDFHDTWDLDGTDFTPEASPDDEGYWDDFENVVTNGTFDADSNWTKGTNWSISNGKAVGTSTTTNLQQLSILEVGTTYELTFTISDYSSGSVKPNIGGVDGATRSSDGTFTEIIGPATTTHFYFDGVSAFTGKIDNVSISEYAIQPLDV